MSRGSAMVYPPAPLNRFCRLLNDFIRPLQQRRRDRQPEGLGGLEVDDQLELRGLLHRHVALPSANRRSIAMFWPSIQPRSCSPCQNASLGGYGFEGENTER